MRVTDDNSSRVDIHPTVVEKKLLENHRGGYCFEVNQYIHYVLRTLGYHVTPITARVVWMAPPDKQAFRNHVINLVTFAPTEEKPIFNQYICDVSFGSPSFVAPLCVHETMLGISQSTAYDTHRVIPFEPTFDEAHERDPEYPLPKQPVFMLNNAADHYMVQTLTDSGRWESLYFFHKREIATFADWYSSNWNVSTRPDSIFKNNIYISKLTEDSKIVIFNDKFMIRRNKDGIGFSSETVLRPPSNTSSAPGESSQSSTSTVKEAHHVDKRKFHSREEFFECMEELFGYPVDQVVEVTKDENGQGGDTWREGLIIPNIDIVHPYTLPL